MRSNRLFEFTTNSKALQRPTIEHCSPSYKNDDNETITHVHNACSIHPSSEPQVKSVLDTSDAVKSKNDIMSDTQKHPVSKLNEIMVILNKDKVKYSIVNEALENINYFKCSATSNCIVANGIGKSKREAKKNAAIALIELLRSDFSNIFTNVEKISLSKDAVNHVGVLHQFCSVRSLASPDYEYIDDTIQNNRFTIKCFLYGYTTKGNGRSKKMAKKEAAILMYNQIKDLSPCEIKNHFHNKSQTPSTVLGTYNKSVNHETMRPSSVLQEYNNSANPMMPDKQKAFSTLDSFFDRIKSSTNPSLSRLRKMKHIHLYGMDAIKTLIDISNEEEFTIHYEIISNQSSNLVKVMIKLSVAPNLMHMGYGLTAFSAIREAGYHVLVYLKLILT